MNRLVPTSVFVFLLMVFSADAQSGQSKPPAGEAVTKLIDQLGADDFRTREKASNDLVHLGGKILPTLRKAAGQSRNLEVKRRIEQVVGRIENALLESARKAWQKLDAPQRSIKERLERILATSPALNDRQLITAVYLVTVARKPTDDEATRAEKQFSQSRPAAALRLARSLVQTKGFNREVAAAIESILKVQNDLAGEMNLAARLQRLNGPEFQKLTDTVAASLSKAVKSDEHYVDLVFLACLSRFPDGKQAAVAIAHLKQNAQNRAMATSNVVWAVASTKEFTIGQR